MPPTVREPRVGGPPGAGCGTPPGDADSSVLPGDLLGALKLLQTIMSAEDVSKFEKMVTPPKEEKDQGKRVVAMGKSAISKQVAETRSWSC